MMSLLSLYKLHTWPKHCWLLGKLAYPKCLFFTRTVARLVAQAPGRTERAWDVSLTVYSSPLSAAITATHYTNSNPIKYK